MFDAHCHLDLFDGDPAAAWAAARTAGVRGAVLAGVDPPGWAAQAALAAALPGLAVTFGVHPWTAADARDEDEDGLLAALDAALDGDPRPVGLGETGLDWGRRCVKATRPRQERMFRAQLALARARDLPVVLHVVAAQGRALEIVRADGLPAAGGMIHRYSGSKELVPVWVAAGLHLSLSPAVLHSPRLAQAARRVPADRLLVETDAPDALPASAGGDDVEMDALPRVVAAVAAARGASPAEIAALTERNARRLFGLPTEG